MQRLRRPQAKVLHCMLQITLFLTFLPLAQSPLTGFAQTPPTNVTSSGLNTTVVPPTGGSTTTAIRGGTLSPNNANLFHSFGEFSVGQNAIAEFQNVNAEGTAPLVSNPASVSNVIGRVTGGNPSNIFGTIDSQTGFPNANLFLINPAGIVFGPGAALNVGGSVNFSTADYLRMGIGNELFYADLGRSSTLSSAPVTAFGFLGSNPIAIQAIEVQGNLSLTGANSLSLIGRDIGSGPTAVPGLTIVGGRISNPGGRINLVSVGTPLDPNTGGEVSAIDFNPESSSSGHGFASLGGILMTNGDITVSDVSGPAVGEIVIRGGQLTMEGGSRLLARTMDVNTIPGAIDINVTGTVALSGNQTAIDTDNSGSATIPGADILLHAGTLSVTDGAQIRTTNNSQNAAAPRGGIIDITADAVVLSGAIDGGGNTVQSGLFAGTTRTSAGLGGSIRVTANELSILDGAAIDTSTFSSAHAGNIEITATSIHVSGVNNTNGVTSPPSAISSKATWDRQADNPNQEQQNTGNGGNINIGTASLDIRDGGQLTTSTETAGNAGTIVIAAETISIAGGQGVRRSGISTDTESTGSPAGAGGNVILTASTLDLQDGAIIDLSTHSDAAAGNLNLNAGTVTLSNGSSIQSLSQGTGGIAGSGGILSITANTLSLSDSTLSTRADASGDGGSIVINAGNVTLLGPIAKIDSGTISTGSGGNIMLNASNRLVVQEGAVTTSASGNGNAGTVQVSADQVVLSGSGEISSSTTSGGAGGTVSVTGRGPTGSVQLSGGSITAATTGSGNAGNISVSGNTVTLSGTASSIDSSTTGSGNAGNIHVQAGQVNLENGGAISSASLAPAMGNAGSITVSTSGQFQSTGGTVTTSADNGQGGDITIRSNAILLNSGASVTASTTGPLDAGAVRLVAADRIMLQGGTVSTSAAQASGGNITLLAPNLIRLRNGQIISSVQGGAGTTGGDITIDPLAVLLQNNSLILAQAFQGNGGNISITAGVLIVDPSSLIDATSQLGINGQVSLQAPIQSLAGLMTPLPQSFVNNANLYAQHCAANKGGQFSSFVQGARDGVPPQPGDFLSSPLLWDMGTGSPATSHGSSRPTLMEVRLGFAPLSVSDSPRVSYRSRCAS